MPNSVTSLRNSEHLGACTDDHFHSGSLGEFFSGCRVSGMSGGLSRQKPPSFPQVGTDFIPKTCIQLPPHPCTAHGLGNWAARPTAGSLIRSQSLKNTSPLDLVILYLGTSLVGIITEMCHLNLKDIRHVVAYNSKIHTHTHTHTTKCPAMGDWFHERC